MTQFKYKTVEDFDKTIQKRIVENTQNFLLKNVYKEIYPKYKTKGGNYKDILEKAFLSGRIYYINNQIIMGDFNIEIIKELKKIGARIFNKGYLLNKSQLPRQLSNKIFIKQNNDIQEKLDNVINRTISGLTLYKFLSTKEEKIFNKKYLKPLNNLINKSISIEDSLLDTAAKEYIYNTDYKVKGFVEENLMKLRQEIYQKIEEGTSVSELKQTISRQYKLSNNRVKRIAEGETKIFLTNYQDLRFKKAGKDKYKWVHIDPRGETSRTGHVMLGKRSENGELFSLFNDPIDPITKKATRPGKEYGCRCIKVIQL